MLAVIKTGGKQYLVSPGKKIKIEKLDAEVGKEVVFDQILLLDLPAGRQGKNKKIEIGTPLVEGAKVFGKVLSHGKGKKTIAFSYRPKKRYRRKKGHRQPFTEIEIKTIDLKP